jgi:hypothetical protein
MEWERARHRRRHGALPRRRATRPGSSTSRRATTLRFRASRRRAHVDDVVRPGRHARIPRRTRHAATDDQRVCRRVPAPTETAKAFATVGALVGRTVAVRCWRGPRGRGVRCARHPLYRRGAITDEASDAILGAWEDEWAPHTGPVGSGPTSGSVLARCNSRTHPDLDRRVGQAALRRRASGRRLDPAGDAADRLADDIAFILRESDKVRPGAVPRSATAGCTSGSPTGTCRSSR